MNDPIHTNVPPAHAGATLPIDHLTQIPPGRVRMWFCPDVVDTLAQLELTTGLDPDTPLVALAWPPGADLPRAMGHIVRALAGVAWARWPNWYGEAAPFDQPDVGAEAAADYDGRVIDRLGAAHPGLNRAWAGQAIRRRRRDERPVLAAFPPGVQVQQLMLALAQPDLILLLALESENTPDAELQGFARTAAWAAGETGTRVAAFVPSAYGGAEALDPIAYGAVNLDGASSRDGSPNGPRGGSGGLPAMAGGNLSYPPDTPRERERSVFPANAGTQERAGAGPVDSLDTPVHGKYPSANDHNRAAPARVPEARAPRRPNDEPLRLVFPPIVGRPHPSSPGEQLLAAWLARDAELAPLFAFNQRVDTSGSEAFVVDLLWRDGKLTVEVDGYSWHSSPHAFAADRHRDYRLLCDGYRTLRLPHDEVMDDPALQCEKIRDIVRVIQKEI